MGFIIATLWCVAGYVIYEMLDGPGLFGKNNIIARVLYTVFWPCALIGDLLAKLSF